MNSETDQSNRKLTFLYMVFMVWSQQTNSGNHSGSFCHFMFVYLCLLLWICLLTLLNLHVSTWSFEAFSDGMSEHYCVYECLFWWQSKIDRQRLSLGSKHLSWNAFGKTPRGFISTNSEYLAVEGVGVVNRKVKTKHFKCFLIAAGTFSAFNNSVSWLMALFYSTTVALQTLRTLFMHISAFVYCTHLCLVFS